MKENALEHPSTKMEIELNEQLESLSKKLPKFPDGRINYSKSNIAPIVVVFVSYKGKILLLKRSKKVAAYYGKWNTVAGYIDEFVHIHEKMLEELHEELGLKKIHISALRLGQSYLMTDKKIKKKWMVYPGIVYLSKKPKIKIDWEHTEYKWIKPKDVKKYDIVKDVDRSLRNAVNGKYVFAFLNS
ncbi:MAG: NUDIX domain-containing protein [Candidatus Micrarchaeales archaeon]